MNISRRDISSKNYKKVTIQPTTISAGGSVVGWRVKPPDKSDAVHVNMTATTPKLSLCGRTGYARVGQCCEEGVGFYDSSFFSVPDPSLPPSRSRIRQRYGMNGIFDLFRFYDFGVYLSKKCASKCVLYPSPCQGIEL